MDRHSTRSGRLDPLHGEKFSSPAISSFETTMLLGVIGGRLTGVLGGVLLALPAFCMVNGRPCHSTCCAALSRDSSGTSLPTAKISGRFPQVVDLSIYRWIRRNLPKPHPFEWQTMFFVTIVGLRFVQTELSRFAPSYIQPGESDVVGRNSDLCHLSHCDRNRAQNLE